MKSLRYPTNKRAKSNYEDLFSDVVQTDQFLDEEIIKEFADAIRDRKNIQI